MTSATDQRLAARALALLLLLFPGSALAQSAADVSLARQLGNQGLELASSGDCGAAVEKLKRAEALYHAPTTLTVLGECHLTLGKLVDGVEELTRVSREELGPRSPPAFRKAQARARLKLEPAKARLPKVRIVVDGVHGDTSMEVRIDGQTVPVATLDLDRPVDPGPHTIEVSAIGYKPAAARIVSREATSQDVKLTLEELPAPPSVVAATPVPAAPPGSSSSPSFPGPVVTTTEAPSTRATYVPALVFLGVGAAGIAVGSILGVETLNKASHLDGACQPRSDCPSSEQGEIDSAKTLALGSTVAFGVGAVGAVVGTYFLLKPPRRSENGPAAAAVGVRPWIGLGSAGLAGVF